MEALQPPRGNEPSTSASRKSDARSSIEPLKLPGRTVLSSCWTQQPVKRQPYFSTSGIFSWTRMRSRSSTLRSMRLPPRTRVCGSFSLEKRPGSDECGRNQRSRAPTAEHDVSAFDSGTPELDNWLKRRALANEAMGTSRTYVVTAGGRVVAFYALANGAVAHKDVSAKTRRNMPDPIPVMVLARLAVDSAYQKQVWFRAFKGRPAPYHGGRSNRWHSRGAASCDVRRCEAPLCTCRISRVSGRSNDDDDHARGG